MVGGTARRLRVTAIIPLRKLAKLRSAAALRGPWHAALTDRAVLALKGPDSRKLLQGLVTSDVSVLDAGPQYTAFLGANGRILFDAFLVSAPTGGVLIDVAQTALEGVKKHLRRYRLRSKTEVCDSSDYAVFALGGSCTAGSASALPPCDGGAWVDPRLPWLGQRVFHRRGHGEEPDWLSKSSHNAGLDLYALQLALL